MVLDSVYLRDPGLPHVQDGSFSRRVKMWCGWCGLVWWSRHHPARTRAWAPAWNRGQAPRFALWGAPFMDGAVWLSGANGRGQSPCLGSAGRAGAAGGEAVSRAEDVVHQLPAADTAQPHPLARRLEKRPGHFLSAQVPRCPAGPGVDGLRKSLILMFPASLDTWFFLTCQ